MPFPAPPNSFPTKDEMADYLEGYAAHFELPILSSVRVNRLRRRGSSYLVEAGQRSFQADQVIVAMADHQKPKTPSFAKDLDPKIVQLHSIEYKNPSQLRPGAVLLVGAGNSGSELAMELCKTRDVVMAGRDTGHLPFRIDGFLGRVLLVRLVLRVVFHRILSIATPIGRKLRPRFLVGGGPLIRVKPLDLMNAGVRRMPRVTEVRGGLPVLEDGQTLDVPNVVFCTGYHPGFSWIDLDIFDEQHLPKHQGGVVPEAPGLYFVGLHFLYSLSSEMIHGVGRDAARISAQVAANAPGIARLRAPATRMLSA
jgi:putative flavoprotein involved in K+ transport